MTTEYTFIELHSKTIAELEQIKKEKLDELYRVNQLRSALCANILATQNMIKCEYDLVQDSFTKGVSENSVTPPVPPTSPSSREITEGHIFSDH